MQIQSLKYNNQPTAFKGLRSKSSKALFAFDLDGTFAHGTQKDIKKVLELAQDANATLAYVTGRTFERYNKLNLSLAKKGISLPQPDILITNNGQFIYEKAIKRNTEWEKFISQKTGFDKNIIQEHLRKLANLPAYLLGEKKLNCLKEMEDIEHRKALERDFLYSKISFYEFHSSEFSLEYIISPDVNIRNIQRDIRQSLKEQRIRPEFIFYKFPKSTIDICDIAIMKKSRPFRENSNGDVKAMLITNTTKGDAVNYVREKLDIAPNEVLAAGDERNDHSLAMLTKNGGIFICVANATQDFKGLIKRMATSQNPSKGDIILASQEGTKGIVEGISRIFSSCAL